MSEISPSEKRQQLLKYVNKTILGPGLTREELEVIKHELVAPGWSVDDLIEAGLASGQVKLREGRLVIDYSKITVKPNSELEEALRRTAAQTGIPPADLLLNFAKERLMPE